MNYYNPVTLILAGTKKNEKKNDEIKEKKNKITTIFNILTKPLFRDVSIHHLNKLNIKDVNAFIMIDGKNYIENNQLSGNTIIKHLNGDLYAPAFYGNTDLKNLRYKNKKNKNTIFNFNSIPILCTFKFNKSAKFYKEIPKTDDAEHGNTPIDKDMVLACLLLARDVLMIRSFSTVVDINSIKLYYLTKKHEFIPIKNDDSLKSYIIQDYPSIKLESLSMLLEPFKNKSTSIN